MNIIQRSYGYIKPKRGRKLIKKSRSCKLLAQKEILHNADDIEVLLIEIEKKVKSKSDKESWRRGRKLQRKKRLSMLPYYSTLDDIKKKYFHTKSYYMHNPRQSRTYYGNVPWLQYVPIWYIHNNVRTIYVAYKSRFQKWLFLMCDSCDMNVT